ncbi:MAG: hypothetical protein Tsb002_00980 [Wenzhouxiangellaceae bacterium]
MNIQQPEFVGLTAASQIFTRDILIDRLASESFAEIVETDANQILDWENAPTPADQRIGRLISTAHTKDELKQMLVRGYKILGSGLDLELDDSDNDDIGGGVETVTCGIIVGVVAGVAAAWIYDEFIDNEDNTTIITDDQGTDWEIVTDDEGNVKRIRRTGGRSE